MRSLDGLAFNQYPHMAAVIATQQGFPSVEQAGRLGRGRSSDTNSGFVPRKFLQNKKRLDDCTRIVLFNTNSFTVSKVWEELQKILDPEFLSQIVKMQRFTGQSRRPRVDMWVKKAGAAALIRLIRDQTRERTFSLVKAMIALGHCEPEFRRSVVGGWRPAIWQSWRDRRVTEISKPEEIGAVPIGRSIMTLNVNGFHKKKLQLLDIVQNRNVVVLAIQETLVSERNYQVRLPGFDTYEVNRQENFRGQALLVDCRLSSYEVSHECFLIQGVKFAIHVKVSGLPGLKRPAHFLAVYLPSGGAERLKKSILLRNVMEVARDILEKENGALIFCMGDFNYSQEEVDKRLAKNGYVLSRKMPVGSGMTRFPVTGKIGSLDHILVSPGANAICRRPRVHRKYCLSDHRPVITSLRVAPEDFREPEQKPRYDLKRINRCSEQLVSHNRWDILPVDEIVDADELIQSVEQFSSVTKDVAQSCGMLVSGGGRAKERLPESLKRLLKRHKRYSKEVATEAEELGSPTESTVVKMRHASRAFKSAYKTWKRNQKEKLYTRIADDFIAHDHKNVWSRLRAQTSKVVNGESLPPVRDEQGELQTNVDGIMDTITNHYSKLANDDPLRVSGDPDHWATKDLGEEKPLLKGLNVELSWKEVLLAIRRMNRNTSPGKCGMHANMLKALVKEECMAKLKEENPEFNRPDNIRVDLPANELPDDPLTKMGVALFRVLKAVWALETIPDLWNEVYIHNLLKDGDPELLVNYRGISLISVSLKILLGIMGDRLSVAVEASDLIVPEQSGFRRREEAISQFIAVAEIVRRRHLKGDSTFGVFIDFKKAYDKVHHEALYRILDNMGVRGKFLRFIKNMYKNSIMTVRAGGYLGNSFRMKRGTRQGCPLSPLLFILFINHILKGAASVGVKVPGLFQDKCDGGLYADDVIALVETAKAAQEVCTHIYEWGQQWGMELGIGKCGVMCWSDSVEVKAAHDSMTYNTPAGEIPKVKEYKYLGIYVTETLHKSREPLEGMTNVETKHSKRMAEKGFKALGTLRPLLTDRACPVPLKVALVRNLVMPLMTYGGEFIAFKKVHAQPIQRVVNCAARWIMGVSNSNHSYAAGTLCFELGLPPVEVELAGLRARLYYKLKLSEKKMKTWLQTLHDNPINGWIRSRSWCSLNQSYITTLVEKGGWMGAPKKGRNKYATWREAYDESDDEWPVGHILHIDPHVPAHSDRQEISPLREWAARGRMYELHIRSNQYESPFLAQLRAEASGIDKDGFTVRPWEGVEEEEDQAYYRDAVAEGILLLSPDLIDERRMQDLLVVSSTKRSVSEESKIRLVKDCLLERLMTADRSEAFKWYDKYCFGASRGFLRATISRPDLREGVRWLIAIRTRSFPRVDERWRRITYSGKVPEFKKGKCPLCKGKIKSGFEWAHLMVKCSHPVVEGARVVHLHTPIGLASRPFKHLGDSSLDKDLVNIAGVSDQNARLGGVIAIYLVGGVVNNSYDCSYHMGFGQLNYMPEGLDKFGYVPVAQFLQEIAHVYAKALSLSSHGGDRDIPSSPEGSLEEEMQPLGLDNIPLNEEEDPDWRHPGAERS